MDTLKIKFLLPVYALIALFTVFCFDGVGDTGDSVMHYLFAKYAPWHPELFFDHWAKPMFVILSSPFAQFGMKGMKLFNVICLLGNLYFAVRVAEALKLKLAWAASIFIFFAPLCFTLTFSGLTEPLFAFWLTVFLFFEVVKQKHIIAALWVSFLPFVRSEGLIILIPVGLYYLLDKRFLALLLLGAGHVIMGLAGSFVYGTVFWVITKIPYTGSGSYGSGKLFHFVHQLFYVIGLPIYGLLLFGFISGLVKSDVRRNRAMFILIMGGFALFFAAHSLFWYFGLFHSFGLKRVMVAVIPLISLIALIGLNTLNDALNKIPKWQKGVVVFIVALTVIFPLLGTPSSIHWKKDLGKEPVQDVCEQVGTYFSKRGGIAGKFCYASPYLSETLNVDYFNPSQHVMPGDMDIKNLVPGDYLIWDFWFCPVEFGMTLERLQNEYGLSVVKEFVAKSDSDVRFVILTRSK